ncbi:MAG: L-threonylcarbamoyladenylate synthase [Pseudomonadota bacterium]
MTPKRSDVVALEGREAEIERAAATLRAGELVALPTETVYGLGADATNPKAVAKIFAAKERPTFNPLISHFASIAQISAYAELDDQARLLGEAFWPGPLTLVLAREPSSDLADLVTAGLPTMGVRVPAHPLTRAVLSAFGKPVAAPSANPSGRISPTTADHVRDGLGERVDFILDGGPSSVGLESTILQIDANTVTLLRPGGISVAEIERVTGAPIRHHNDEGIVAPGMMKSHYAPGTPLRLNAIAPNEGEAFLAFGTATQGHYTINLSPTGDLVEAAANLFSAFHKLDALCTENDLEGIAVAPIPEQGLGLAINDRLARAAAPRS